MYECVRARACMCARVCVYARARGRVNNPTIVDNVKDAMLAVNYSDSQLRGGCMYYGGRHNSLG